tara:strand:- start:12471 stop:12905 length:435 start_codon:yes stop_codon:yes gene_type:complete
MHTDENNNKSQSQITGECFCGSIRYQINGNLRNARSCHCSRCRKAFSAQASAYAMVNPDEFSWISGENLLTSYVSKKGMGLQFCSVCGTTICGIYKGTIHGITLGSVNGDPEVEIGIHIYVGSKATWEIIPDGAVTYQEGAPEK